MKQNSNKILLALVGTSILFFLGSLLIFFRPATSEYDAVRHMLEHNAEITSRIPESESYYPKKLEQGRYTDEDIKNITRFSFFKRSPDWQDIRALSSLKHVKELAFSEVTLSDRAIKEISNTQWKPRELMMLRSSFSKEGGFYLSKIEGLKIFGMVYCDITDDNLQLASGLEADSISFYDTPISERGLMNILPQNKLKGISLMLTDITDGITGFLNECPNLESITITDSPAVRCRFLLELKNTDAITHLQIARTSLDDEILMSFTPYNNLNYLEIVNCRITEKCRDLLQEWARKMYFVRVETAGQEIIFSHRMENYRDDD